MSDLDIKKIREELNLTQQELANKLEVNIRTVQKWESGEANIRKSTAFMINELRKKGISYFTNEPESNYPKTELSEKFIEEVIEAFRHNWPELMKNEKLKREFIYRASGWAREVFK